MGFKGRYTRGVLLPENSLGGRETLLVRFLGSFCDLINIIHKMGFNFCFFVFAVVFEPTCKKEKGFGGEKHSLISKKAKGINLLFSRSSYWRARDLCHWSDLARRKLRVS